MWRPIYSYPTQKIWLKVILVASYVTTVSVVLFWYSSKKNTCILVMQDELPLPANNSLVSLVSYTLHVSYMHAYIHPLMYTKFIGNSRLVSLQRYVSHWLYQDAAAGPGAGPVHGGPLQGDVPCPLQDRQGGGHQGTLLRVIIQPFCLWNINLKKKNLSGFEN